MAKGGTQQKKLSPEGGLRTIKKPELEENIKNFWKKILHLYHHIYKKEKRWRVFKM